MAMSKLTERQRMILTVAVMVILTGGLLALILNDRGEIKTVEEEISALDARIAAADREIALTREREDKVLTFRAVEPRELEVLPTEQMITRFHNNLATFLSTAGLDLVEIPENAPVESDLAPGIWVTRTPLSCRGDSASLLNFLNMMENDPRLVAVKGFKVRAGSKRATEPGKAVKHDIDVHLETYYYAPRQAGAKPVDIPGGERRQQQSPLKEAIAAFQPERPDTYVLRPSSSRRDALVDPREARPTVDPEEEEEERRRQEDILIDLENRLTDINEHVEQEEALARLGMRFRQAQLAEETDRLLNEAVVRLAQVDEMKTVVLADLLGRLDEVRKRLGEVAGRRPQKVTTVTLSMAQTMYDDIRKAFDAGQYTEVGTMIGAWEQFLQGKQVASDAQSTIQAIADLRQRAKHLAEFQAFKIRFTGAIVNEADPARSVALLNGRPARTGDRLDDVGGATVGRIARGQVELLYKGESVIVKRGSGR